MPSLLVDCFCHGGYYVEKGQLSSMLSLTIPAIMETDTVKAFRM